MAKGTRRTRSHRAHTHQHFLSFAEARGREEPLGGGERIRPLVVVPRGMNRLTLEKLLLEPAVP